MSTEHECCISEFIKQVGEKEIKCEACFLAECLINSIIQEQDSIYHMTIKLF